MLQAMSLFSQLLQHFPSLGFGALVKKHNAERGAKGFSRRTQLVAMFVLPTGSRRFPARNLQRACLLCGQTGSPRNPDGSEQILAGLCQSAAARRVV